MSHFGAIGHHLIVAIIDHIPNGWVMFNGDMTNDPWLNPTISIGQDVDVWALGCIMGPGSRHQLIWICWSGRTGTIT